MGTEGKASEQQITSSSGSLRSIAKVKGVGVKDSQRGGRGKPPKVGHEQRTPRTRAARLSLRPAPPGHSLEKERSNQPALAAGQIFFVLLFRFCFQTSRKRFSVSHSPQQFLPGHSLHQSCKPPSEGLSLRRSRRERKPGNCEVTNERMAANKT